MADREGRARIEAATRLRPIDSHLRDLLEVAWFEIEQDGDTEIVPPEELFLMPDEELGWVAADGGYAFRYRSMDESIWTFWLTWSQLRDVVREGVTELAMIRDDVLDPPRIP